MQHKSPDILQSAIIGCLINWPEEIDLVSSALQPEDFISQKHRECYLWMLSNQGKGFDLVTLAHGLKGKIPAEELTEWGFTDATSAFLPRYCRELKEATNRIRLHELASEVRTMCSQDKSYTEIREHMDSKLSQIGTVQRQAPIKSAMELTLSTVKRLEKRYESKGELTGIPYGWPDLDQKTNGMHRGDLIIVAGRPSMGKSAFAGNVLEAVSANGFTGALFSLEMGQDQVMDRMTASVGRVHYGAVRSGNLQDQEWSKITKACSIISNWPMTIDDSPSLSLADLKRKCRKLKETGLDFVAVDYLQLMKMTSRENRVQAIGEVSRGLKLLARELDIVVMALSQLNRGVDSRTDKRPTMSDLRDSGEIEQDADVILFPFRPAAYCDKCRDQKEDADHSTVRHQMVAEIIIEKQRNGERNISIPMAWHGKYQRFDSLRRL